MKKILTVVSFFILSLLIVVPRFYDLGKTPPGLHIDELSFAADALSLAETGRDTWGQKFPNLFQAFGEWKAPGLTYSLALVYWLTNQHNAFYTRLPSALFGLISLVFFFLTLKNLYPKHSPLALLFLTAVLGFSPWHFAISRVYLESLGGLACLAGGLYFALLSFSPKVASFKDLVLPIIFFGLAGYFYGSFRVVAILLVILTLFVAKTILRQKLLVALLFLLVSSGWVGELYSARGTSRLAYYSQKINTENVMVIDENRQYCHLFGSNFALSNSWCKLIWNKPLERLYGHVATFAAYYSPEFLFFKLENEYGGNESFGAYPEALLPFYLVGLALIVGSIKQLLARPSHTLSRRDQALLYLFIVSALSLLPATLATYLDMRMSVLHLYIIGLILALAALDMFNKLLALRRQSLALSLYLIVGTFLLLSLLRSLTHYFFVYTKSNDDLWTSDTHAVFAYVKSISPQYDRIIDTSLHGPLAPYYYGDLSAQAIQDASRSKPDDLGFIFITKAGKYERLNKEVEDLACEKWGNNDPRKTIVIANYLSKYESFALFTTHTMNQARPLRGIYDLDQIITYELDHNTSFKTTCSNKP